MMMLFEAARELVRVVGVSARLSLNRVSLGDGKLAQLGATST